MTCNLEFGDQVRHPQRPEWGIGSVVKTERTTAGGTPDVRISVRFPNAGLKTLLASAAALEPVQADDLTPHALHDNHTLAAREAESEQGWLGEIAKSKPEDAMIALPPAATDPFLPLPSRLEGTLSLYRFTPDGRHLVDWAVAQSGLTDPLSRFNRHELQRFFERWRHNLDEHLAKLLADARADPAAVRNALAAAPPAAQQMVRKLASAR